MAGAITQREHPCAWHQAANFAQRHEIQAFSGKAHYLGLSEAWWLVAAGGEQFDATGVTQRHAQPHGFDHHAGGTQYPPAGAIARHRLHTGMHAAQRLLPAGLVWVDRCRHITHYAVLLLVGFGFVAFSDLGLYRLPAALPGGIEFTIGAG